MIYILGGNGFVGSGYVRYLRESGHDVIVIDRHNYQDFVDSECDVLINANGNSKKFVASTAPKEDFQASVASVRNSLVDFRAKKYVFLSTSDVYTDCSNMGGTREDGAVSIQSLNPYGFHKYLAELCVQYAAKDWLIIRQGGFVGPGLKKNAIYDILYGDKLWVHPDSEFQFISTDESARIVMELVSKGVTREIFNVTARGTISVRAAMVLAGRTVLSGNDSPVVHYEISTAKVSKRVNLPDTTTVVDNFFRDLRR